MRSPDRLLAPLVTTATVIGLSVLLNATDQRPTNVGASPKDTPTPTPSSRLVMKEGMPSQRNIQELARQLLQGKESIQSVQNPIHFVNRAGKQTDWFFDNARWGIPPNDSDKLTGTVDVLINTTYLNSFQTKNSLYPEIANGTAIRTTIDGQVVDTATWKGYMATAIDTGNIFYERIERIYDVNNPTDYSDGARMLFKDDVVGNIAQNGDLGGFYMGQDSQGKYLDLVIIHAVNSADNGTYRIRLDSQGKFLGSFFKVASAEPTPTPTSIATPQPTVTVTPTTSPNLNKKIYIPSVMKNTSGK